MGRSPQSVRLACVKHAASVRSEPGSNSHVHPDVIPNRPGQTPRRTQPQPPDTPSLITLNARLRKRSASSRRRPRIPSILTHNLNQRPRIRWPLGPVRRTGTRLIGPVTEPGQSLFGATRLCVWHQSDRPFFRRRIRPGHPPKRRLGNGRTGFELRPCAARLRAAPARRRPRRQSPPDRGRGRPRSRAIGR